MSFRLVLVPKSVTLNNLERRNGRFARPAFSFLVSPPYFIRHRIIPFDDRGVRVNNLPRVSTYEREAVGSRTCDY